MTWSTRYLGIAGVVACCATSALACEGAAHWIQRVTEAGSASGQGAHPDGAQCLEREASDVEPYALVCTWTFPYRAPEAESRYDGLAAGIEACLGEDSQLKKDQPVNHPDSYTLRRFLTPKAKVSVSLKDKAARAETYVFLRIAMLQIE